MCLQRWLDPLKTLKKQMRGRLDPECFHEFAMAVKSDILAASLIVFGIKNNGFRDT